MRWLCSQRMHIYSKGLRYSDCHWYILQLTILAKNQKTDKSWIQESLICIPSHRHNIENRCACKLKFCLTHIQYGRTTYPCLASSLASAIYPDVVVGRHKAFDVFLFERPGPKPQQTSSSSSASDSIVYIYPNSIHQQYSHANLWGVAYNHRASHHRFRHHVVRWAGAIWKWPTWRHTHTQTQPFSHYWASVCWLDHIYIYSSRCLCIFHRVQH